MENVQKHNTCVILLELINLTIRGQEQRLNIRKFFITQLSPASLNFLLLRSKCSQCFVLSARNQVSHKYKTTRSRGSGKQGYEMGRNKST
jgi:hypothetical protein